MRRNFFYIIVFLILLLLFFYVFLTVNKHCMNRYYDCKAEYPNYCINFENIKYKTVGKICESISYSKRDGCFPGNDRGTFLKDMCCMWDNVICE